MTTFIEEMKQQSQFILKNLRKRGQLRLEVASTLKDKFLTNSGGQHSKNLREAGEFHRSPMQVEARYLPPHRRKGGTLENMARERPNAAKAITIAS